VGLWDHGLWRRVFWQSCYHFGQNRAAFLFEVEKRSNSLFWNIIFLHILLKTNILFVFWMQFLSLFHFITFRNVENYGACNGPSDPRSHTFRPFLYRAVKWETLSRSGAETSTSHCLIFLIMNVWLANPSKCEVRTRMFKNSVPTSLHASKPSIIEFNRLLLLGIKITAYCKKHYKRVSFSHLWPQCRNKFWGPACPMYIHISF